MNLDSNGSRDAVVVLGGGGREHAIAWKLAQSPLVRQVFVLPGNPGMTPPWDRSPAARKIERVAIAADDIRAVVAFAEEHGIGLIVPGPELPLVLGIADAGRAAGIPVFGPSQRAAMSTEGSKCDAKTFMERNGIPTAPFRCFGPGDRPAALSWIAGHDLPVVIKDDGLAGGKGVTIATSRDEALGAIHRRLDAGKRLVVERYLTGTELTFTCMVAGEQYLPLAAAQDRKLFKGQMTGGMGAVSSDELMDGALAAKITSRIVEPTVRGLVQEGSPYLGFLYFGLMVVGQDPYVLEFNCRLGDPEAQVILIRFWSDLYRVIRAAGEGYLSALNLLWDPSAAAVVVMAAAGYPGQPRTGDPIRGVGAAERCPGVKIFTAGVAEKDGALLTAGGRVLGVTATAATAALAERLCYRGVRKIYWTGCQHLKRLGCIPPALASA